MTTTFKLTPRAAEGLCGVAGALLGARDSSSSPAHPTASPKPPV